MSGFPSSESVSSGLREGRPELLPFPVSMWTVPRGDRFVWVPWCLPLRGKQQRTIETWTAARVPLCFQTVRSWMPFLQRWNRRGGYATCHLKTKKLVHVRVYKSSHITWNQLLEWVSSCVALGLDVCPSVLPRECFFFLSLMCRDVSLVTTQLGDVSLGLHDCTHEERREFIDGRGFTASIVTDSFPGLREHRVVL